MLLLKSKKKWWKMSLVVTSFSNDDRAYHPTLLKIVSTIDILIDQVHKFQNSYFKEHLWKAATVIRKTCCIRGVLWNITHNNTFKKDFIEAHRNTASIDLRFQFRLVTCFTLSFYYTGVCTVLLFSWSLLHFLENWKKFLWFWGQSVLILVLYGLSFSFKM